MAYIITTLGMKLADPATVQAFETVEVNADFEILEDAILADRVRLDEIDAGPNRGTRAVYYVTDLDGIALITDELEGDLAYCDEGNFYLQRDDADWVQVTPATFVDATARDAAFAKAAAAYLVAGATAKVGLLDLRYTGTIWRRGDVGLVPIKPTSVAGTGVTVDAAGKVSFVSSDAVNINGCFTAEFDNYLLLVDMPTVAPVAGLSLRLRAAGVDDSSANYDREMHTTSGATSTGVEDLAANSWAAITVGNRSTIMAKIDIMGPAKTQRTAAMARVFAANATANPGLTQSGLRHRSATAFDGISLLQTGGGLSFNGTAMIYGYND